MTQDEIIEMARQAGLEVDGDYFSDAIYRAVLTRFAKLVAAKEREACNEICKDAYEWAELRIKKDGSDSHYSGRMRAAQDIGHAIRARGEA